MSICTVLGAYVFLSWKISFLNCVNSFTRESGLDLRTTSSSTGNVSSRNIKRFATYFPARSFEKSLFSRKQITLHRQLMKDSIARNQSDIATFDLLPLLIKETWFCRSFSLQSWWKKHWLQKKYQNMTNPEIIRFRTVCFFIESLTPL